MSEHRLSEIVIERPRHGMRCSSRRLKGARKTLNRLAEIATEEGLLSPYLIKTRGKTKCFADHLGPLRRLLRSKVNQPWNTVYSDLCHRLDANTLTGQHVLSHLWGYVERHVEIVDGIPYRKSYSCYGIRRLGSRYQNEFYIHPETGLLCLAEYGARPVAPKQDDIIAVDAYHQYRKLKEVWYGISFADLPPWGLAWDVLRKADISPEIAQRDYGRPIYASRKIQCNKRLLKALQSKIFRP